MTDTQRGCRLRCPRAAKRAELEIDFGAGAMLSVRVDDGPWERRFLRLHGGVIESFADGAFLQDPERLLLDHFTVAHVSARGRRAGCFALVSDATKIFMHADTVGVSAAWKHEIALRIRMRTLASLAATAKPLACIGQAKLARIYREHQLGVMLVRWADSELSRRGLGHLERLDRLCDGVKLLQLMADAPRPRHNPARLLVHRFENVSLALQHLGAESEFLMGDILDAKPRVLLCLLWRVAQRVAVCEMPEGIATGALLQSLAVRLCDKEAVLSGSVREAVVALTATFRLPRLLEPQWMSEGSPRLDDRCIILFASMVIRAARIPKPRLSHAELGRTRVARVRETLARQSRPLVARSGLVLPDAPELVRIYLEDGTFRTVRICEGDLAGAVVRTLEQRAGRGDRRLFVVDANGVVERQLADSERVSDTWAECASQNKQLSFRRVEQQIVKVFLDDGTYRAFAVGLSTTCKELSDRVRPKAGYDGTLSEEYRGLRNALMFDHELVTKIIARWSLDGIRFVYRAK